MAEFAEGLGFDLADALAGDLEGMAYLFERVFGALAIGALRMGTGRIEKLNIGKLTVDELVIKKRGEDAAS